MRHSMVTVLLGATLLASCSRTESPAPTADSKPAPAAVPGLTVEALSVPATGQSAQPHLSASSRGVILSWLEHDDVTATFKFAEWTGGTWSPTQTVAASDNWFVSAADVPTVTRLRDGTLVATAYPATDLRAEGYDLQLRHSRDEGKTWSRAIAPHHDGTKTQHGFATLFELADGLGLVWLDGRDQTLNTTDPEGGSMALYYAAFDRNWKQTAEAVVNTRVCECCQTSAAMTDEGPIVAFRDRSPREVRDINVTRLEGGAWTQARPLHVDGWQIDACPVNGPALSARGKTVAAAWFASTADEGHAYAAFSADGGRSWSDPIQLDDAVSLGHVDVELLDDGSAVASWVEFANRRAQLRVRRLLPSGARSDAAFVAGSGDGFVAGYPRLARQGDDLLLAWTETNADGISSQSIKAAVVRLEQ